jgi:hypothetical protein
MVCSSLRRIRCTELLQNIVPGMFADFAVFSDDLLSNNPGGIKDIQFTMTRGGC